MDQNTLFALGFGLGLVAPWKVVRSGLEDGSAESKFLYVDIEVATGGKCHVQSARSSARSVITR